MPQKTTSTQLHPGVHLSLLFALAEQEAVRWLPGQLGASQRSSLGKHHIRAVIFCKKVLLRLQPGR